MHSHFLYDTWLVETEIFSLCKAILYKTTAGQIVTKRVCGYLKNNLTNQQISFETTDQISSSIVLDIDKGCSLRLGKMSGPGKFISPRLTTLKVLKKCSILENRSLSLCFAFFLIFSDCVRLSWTGGRFWAALPGAQHSDECIRLSGMTHGL